MILQPLHHMGLFMALESGLVDALISIDDEDCICAEDIASKAKCDFRLVIRLMRLLTSLGVGREISAALYAPNEAARALGAPGNRGGVDYL